MLGNLCPIIIKLMSPLEPISKHPLHCNPDLQLSPVKCAISGATAVSCGVDFTIWIANGKAMGAGCPQYGQLGDGSDHAYNAKDSSICMVFDPQVPQGIR